MIEIVAAVLVIVWVVGLVAGFSFGGAIHLLLLLSIILILIHRTTLSRARALSQVSPAGILAIVTRKSRSDPEQFSESSGRGGERGRH